MKIKEGKYLKKGKKSIASNLTKVVNTDPGDSGYIY